MSLTGRMLILTMTDLYHAMMIVRHHLHLMEICFASVVQPIAQETITNHTDRLLSLTAVETATDLVVAAVIKTTLERLTSTSRVEMLHPLRQVQTILLPGELPGPKDHVEVIVQEIHEVVVVVAVEAVAVGYQSAQVTASYSAPKENPHLSNCRA